MFPRPVLSLSRSWNEAQEVSAWSRSAPGSYGIALAGDYARDPFPRGTRYRGAHRPARSTAPRQSEIDVEQDPARQAKASASSPARAPLRGGRSGSWPTGFGRKNLGPTGPRRAMRHSPTIVLMEPWTPGVERTLKLWLRGPLCARGRFV